MAQQSWWRQLIAGINAAYERRIRAASLVTEYGANHHGHHADHGHDAGQHGKDTAAHTSAAVGHADEATEEGGAIIANVPRGTRIPRSPHSDHAEP